MTAPAPASYTVCLCGHRAAEHVPNICGEVSCLALEYIEEGCNDQSRCGCHEFVEAPPKPERKR